MKIHPAHADHEIRLTEYGARRCLTCHLYADQDPAEVEAEKRRLYGWSTCTFSGVDVEVDLLGQSVHDVPTRAYCKGHDWQAEGANYLAASDLLVAHRLERWHRPEVQT